MSGSTKYTSIVEELKLGNTVTYFTLGVSMRPLLTERKTHVMIAPLKKAENRDILLYIRKNGSLVLHRCIKQDADHYYMRGDNTYGLERIAKEQAVGVVTHIYRKNKEFSVSNTAYRLYAHLWCLLYPLRCAWKFVKRIIRKIIKKGL